MGGRLIPSIHSDLLQHRVLEQLVRNPAMLCNLYGTTLLINSYQQFRQWVDVRRADTEMAKLA